MPNFFASLRPAITFYNTAHVKIITNDCQTLPHSVHTNKSSVVACYYQNIYECGKPIVLQDLILSKMKIDENIVWPIRWWFYKLVDYIHMARILSYKTTEYVFPVPVFESQMYTNFFTVALVLLNNLESTDNLLYPNFKLAILIPLSHNFKTTTLTLDNCDVQSTLNFNRFLLQFIMTLGYARVRHESCAQFVSDILKILQRLFQPNTNSTSNITEDTNNSSFNSASIDGRPMSMFALNNMLTVLKSDVKIFWETHNKNQLASFEYRRQTEQFDEHFELFRDCSTKEIYVHNNVSYTWPALE